ncbi:ComEA family DNA-binding protein [Cognatilysobacter terrigena]|uniref:ComEA family DNA-binding protein n=1 Tax=Cognatilysobacter terrigena TaxID=2488749 RepID=UPI00105F8B8C|nr:ComEA family DNA-binding protein [Lysobacter terrigena]
MKLAHILQTLALSLALASTAAAATPATPARAMPAPAVERVNINTADAATLDRVLVNVGPAKAQEIVSYRKTNGPFRTIDQLALVKGIGLKTIEKNRDRIVLGAVPARPATTGRPMPRVANLQR